MLRVKNLRVTPRKHDSPGSCIRGFMQYPGERRQMLGVAGVASNAQEAVLQPAALQVAIKCLSHMSGQLFTGLGQVFDKGRVVALDELIEQRLLGPVALVAARRWACNGRSWRGLRGHVRP